jgi:hypothetical protein
MGLPARDSRDPLHEIEDALGLAAFLDKHVLMIFALRRLRFRETALAQEFGALVNLCAPRSVAAPPLPR